MTLTNIVHILMYILMAILWFEQSVRIYKIFTNKILGLVASIIHAGFLILLYSALIYIYL